MLAVGGGGGSGVQRQVCLTMDAEIHTSINTIKCFFEITAFWIDLLHVNGN